MPSSKKKKATVQTDRLAQYYKEFLDREVGELIITIAPVRNDIPRLIFVGHDEASNNYIINFDLLGEQLTRTFSYDRVEILQGSSSDKIGRIVIKDFPMSHRQNACTKFVQKAFDKFRESLTAGTGKPLDLVHELRRVGRFDIIDRQLKESKDLVASADIDAA
jgi:hypothetical protein